MKGAARRLAFLDASVPYPALLRNILMYLALNDLFQASCRRPSRTRGRVR